MFYKKYELVLQLVMMTWGSVNRFVEMLLFFQCFNISLLKDVRGWQLLKMKAAVTLCIVCLPPEEHIS